MDDPQLGPSVAALYEKYPYPPVGLFSGLFQRIRWDERQTLNFRALYAAAWGSTEGAPTRPRILVAGCGTFEPVVVALANPSAEIVAVDLSGRSLKLLRQQLRRRGCSGRVLCLQADLLDLPASLGRFDLLISTGVLHHLPDPLAGLRALRAHGNDRAVYRCMIYSAWGRSLLYAAKELAAGLGVSTPGDFRKLIDSLPANHPYKIYFHLYSDSRTDAGIADGFLHPCDRAFTALELRDLLENAGLEAALFLHGPEGRGNGGNVDWDRLAALEAFGELDENFRFVARASGPAALPAGHSFEWNEALPEKGRIFSRLLGKELEFDRSVRPESLSAEARTNLVGALFLLPSGEGK